MREIKKKHYHAIFISDSHFGMPILKAPQLEDFLKHHSCNHLYLVGDILDLWEMKKRYEWSFDCTMASRQIVEQALNGAKVFYIIGNHDGDIRPIMDLLKVEGMTFYNEITHEGLDGKRYLVIHGDLFDNERPVFTVLSKMGNKAYIASIRLNKFLNSIRDLFGLPPWSLSLYLKRSVKGVVKHITRFEEHLVEYSKKGKYDGCICGHIHVPEIRQIDFILYKNCGDWVESCSAIVEDLDGKFELVYWPEVLDVPYSEATSAATT